MVVHDIFCICRKDRRCGISAFRFGNRPCPPSRALWTPSGDFLSCGLVHPSGDLQLRHRSHPRPTPGLPRAFEGPHGRPLWTPGTPAHLSSLSEVWDAMEPALRARLGSVTLQDSETSLERARATATVGGPGRTAADACALSLAEEEYANVLQPLQARAASLSGKHADLSGRLRLNVTQQRSTTADMAAAGRHHLSVTSTFGAGSQQPPPARATTRSAASVTFSVPAASTGSTAPPAPPAAGSTMPPPPPPAARVPFTTAAQWSTVAARRPRQPPPTPRDDRYLDLRISRLMHINSFFPPESRKPIKALASQVEATLKSLHIEPRTLRLAVELATNGSGLCGPLVPDILRLRDLVDYASDTPAGTGWIQEVLDAAAAPRRPARSASSSSDTASSARPRRRYDPSSGRGNSKRVTLSETSDSDDRHLRYQGRHHPDKRQVTARFYHATDDDSDAPSFPPRIFRYRNRSRRPHPRIATPRADCAAPATNDSFPLQKIVEAATAAAIAAVDHHLAHLGLTPRSEPTPSHGTVHYSSSHAAPRLGTVPLPDTVHHPHSHTTPRSDPAPSHDAVLHRPHAVPRPATASLHDTVPHHRSRAIPASLAPLPPPIGSVAPTTEPSATSARASCPPGGSAAAIPTHNGYPLASLVPTPPPPAAPCSHHSPCDIDRPCPCGPFPARTA